MKAHSIANLKKVEVVKQLMNPSSSFPTFELFEIGPGIMGIKSQHVTQRRERAIQAEKAKKLGLQLA